VPLADFSGWWIVGWAVGFGGAVVGAVLLLAIIRLGRTIASQAEEIRDAIESAHQNTGALFDLTSANLALDRIARELAVLREERSP
jgi:hypothetical protein